MDSRTCPKCGIEVDDSQSQGLCPSCLLSSGIESGDPVRKALESKLAGQYRVIRMLGRGGMGAVYLARDLTLEREVAIKVINNESGSPEMYDRFRREAKTAAKLSHPNIVPLHAFGEIEGMPYFVMGYVRGESLTARLAREGHIAEDEARRIVADIADALDHAHRQGIVHRDVKPDNVLLDDETGRALLTDFGIAKQSVTGTPSQSQTRFGTIVGTPQYMSPEQASGHSALDGRSDIYSLGVMAYAMMAGRLPFAGNTAADFLAKHVTQDAAPLRSAANDVSELTSQIVARCLAKDPAKRWPDARSLALALGSSEEEQLHDALQGVESHGISGLAIALVFLLIIRLLHAPRFAILLNIGVIAAVYLIILVRLRMEGLSFAQSQHAMWMEPRWWPMWYPRSLRRRGNVWDRLPSSVRLVRWWLAAFGLFAVLLFVGPFPNAYRNPEMFVIKIVAGFSIMTLSWAVLTTIARSQLRRSGLASPDIERVVTSVPPSRVSFWSKPHIAAILKPVSGAEPVRSDSPHDQLQAILRNSNDLAGPMRALGAQATVAARQLVEAIAECDRQIADLSRSIEPGEDERLGDKIKVLTSPDAAPLRALLEKQLELIAGISARIERIKEVRNRRIEMLKMLSLHIASLRARLTDGTSEVRLLSDNVRALCDEIGRHAEATGDAAPLEDSAGTVER